MIWGQREQSYCEFNRIYSRMDASKSLRREGFESLRNEDAILYNPELSYIFTVFKS
jgi:hypothetical protein